MNAAVLLINGMALAGILIAFMDDRTKAILSINIAFKGFMQILPVTLAIIIVIALFLGFVPPEQLSAFIGEQSGISGVLLIGIAGAIMHIPAILSFPLAASLLEKGISYTAVAALITTLTMIGTVTLPLEISQLGKKFALLRNGISFVIAIIIALLVGVAMEATLWH
ncbi:permease [Methanohalophilus mahii]|uniref:Permease n=1 Tax=Methanohalophilus mahii (strain ATCC 35705 / DSM 5219 / SLP) TaxID=547558 RepID=D5E938_METMS|nr:permease [Methanohalophilus mahii]ADE35689.1 conserved hypothetical protein [Methanohalophilus mahii DSM 5219]